jgi:hypothetical protein
MIPDAFLPERIDGTYSLEFVLTNMKVKFGENPMNDNVLKFIQKDHRAFTCMEYSKLKKIYKETAKDIQSRLEYVQGLEDEFYEVIEYKLFGFLKIESELFYSIILALSLPVLHEVFSLLNLDFEAI